MAQRASRDLHCLHALVDHTINEWAQRDLQAARSWIESGKGPKDEGGVEGLASAWIEKDLNAYLAWATESGNVSSATRAAELRPRPTTDWLLEHDDGSAEFQSVRHQLLRPLEQNHGKAEAGDLDRFFQLVKKEGEVGHSEQEFLGKLFLRFTHPRGSIDADGHPTFSLNPEGPLDELVEKYHYEAEFARFIETQRVAVIRENEIEEEMNLLSDEWQDLHDKSGLEESE